MSRIDQAIAAFMLACEHPSWERLYHHLGLKVNGTILCAKMSGFVWVLDVTGPFATPGLARVYRRYHDRLLEEARGFSATARERTGKPAGDLHDKPG